ncbi:MAG: type II secretion system protein GspH [Desulfobacteraceae bacterium]|jgi:type II secretion system protein H|nr:MAG: type II secretion system protein GspH [Desulfobacteraceae bacterium]
MKSGFTLIELLVVLVLVALVSGFVVPRIVAPFGHLHVKTAATEIAGLLRHCRSQAVSKKIGNAIVFDLDTQEVRVFSPVHPGASSGEELMERMSAETRYQAPDGVRVSRASVGKDVLESGVFTLTFFPNGNSSGGELVIAGETKRQYGIRIDPITGMVAVSVDESGTL